MNTITHNIVNNLKSQLKAYRLWINELPWTKVIIFFILILFLSNIINSDLFNAVTNIVILLSIGIKVLSPYKKE